MRAFVNSFCKNSPQKLLTAFYPISQECSLEVKNFSSPIQKNQACPSVKSLMDVGFSRHIHTYIYQSLMIDNHEQKILYVKICSYLLCTNEESRFLRSIFSHIFSFGFIPLLTLYKTLYLSKNIVHVYIMFCYVTLSAQKTVSYPNPSKSMGECNIILSAYTLYRHFG